MTQEEVKSNLEKLLSRFEDSPYGYPVYIMQYDANYRDALKLAIEAISSYDKKLISEIEARLSQENQKWLKKEKEKLQQKMQDNCSHDWILKRWVSFNRAEYICKKCGKIETFYESD